MPSQRLINLFSLDQISSFMKAIIDPERFRTHLMTNWYEFGRLWFIMNDDKNPHVMIAMIHSRDCSGKLLKGDVVAILAALQTRMGYSKLQKHMVIPVRDIPMPLNPSLIH